jgi:hypothetical protein
VVVLDVLTCLIDVPDLVDAGFEVLDTSEVEDFVVINVRGGRLVDEIFVDVSGWRGVLELDFVMVALMNLCTWTLGGEAVELDFGVATAGVISTEILDRKSWNYIGGKYLGLRRRLHMSTGG